MISTIDHKYNIGDIVYLITDTDQLPRVVYCIRVVVGTVLYEVASGITTSNHYEFELSDTKNILVSS